MASFTSEALCFLWKKQDDAPHLREDRLWWDSKRLRNKITRWWSFARQMVMTIPLPLQVNRLKVLEATSHWLLPHEQTWMTPVFRQGTCSSEFDWLAQNHKGKHKMKNFLGSTPWKLGQEKLDRVAGQRCSNRRTGTCLLSWTQPETTSIPTALPTCGFLVYLSAAIVFHSVFVWESFADSSLQGKSVEELNQEMLYSKGQSHS